MVPSQAQKPYEPRGASLAAWRSSFREVALCGPVRSGKTRLWLEKIHFLCEKYPGARFLISRQTRRSLTSTTLASFENDVVPSGHPVLKGPEKEGRTAYHYPNKSEIIVGGLDEPSRILGAEYDGILISQAEECYESTIETLKTRLSHYVVPFQQLMLDANPGPPNHWLKARCERGACKYLQASFADNPKYCIGTGDMPPDGDDTYWANQQWTAAGIEFLKDAGWTGEGIDYLATLQDITGHRRARLVYGKWQAPEGARFEGASRFIQGFDLMERFPRGIPSHWTRWLSGDYGKADPYCCLWHTSDPETGIDYTYKEDYERGFEADQQAHRIVDASPKNDQRYVGIYLDGSMWNPGVTFGGHPERGPAMDQYAAVFAEANAALGHPKFGPMIKGAQNRNEEAYITLDAKLRNGTWKIARTCTNLWREIEDAVHYKDPKTGISSELINPVPTKKFCDDHALEAGGYGLHKRSPVSSAYRSDTIDPSVIQSARMAEIRKASHEQRNPKKYFHRRH